MVQESMRPGAGEQQHDTSLANINALIAKCNELLEKGKLEKLVEKTRASLEAVLSNIQKAEDFEATTATVKELAAVKEVVQKALELDAKKDSAGPANLSSGGSMGAGGGKGTS